MLTTPVVVGGREPGARQEETRAVSILRHQHQHLSQHPSAEQQAEARTGLDVQKVVAAPVKVERDHEARAAETVERHTVDREASALLHVADDLRHPEAVERQHQHVHLRDQHVEHHEAEHERRVEAQVEDGQPTAYGRLPEAGLGARAPHPEQVAHPEDGEGGELDEGGGCEGGKHRRHHHTRGEMHQTEVGVDDGVLRHKAQRHLGRTRHRRRVIHLSRHQPHLE
mmetsp:Transcript_18662/g.55923  ORF Transcript_18662/g.55923 Transcript_18662/m.55923 type:complete len:226 (-) Transcript_18662:198-875(-)